jgi:hypothetical protein
LAQSLEYIYIYVQQVGSKVSNWAWVSNFQPDPVVNHINAFL